MAWWFRATVGRICGGGAGADDPHPLAGEIDLAPLGQLELMQIWPFEGVEAPERGDRRRR